MQRCTSELPRGAQPALPALELALPGFSSREHKNHPALACMDLKGSVRQLHKKHHPQVSVPPYPANVSSPKPHHGHRHDIPCRNASLPGDIGSAGAGAGAAVGCLRCRAAGTRAAADKLTSATGGGNGHRSTSLRLGCSELGMHFLESPHPLARHCQTLLEQFWCWCPCPQLSVHRWERQGGRAGAAQSPVTKILGPF